MEDGGEIEIEGGANLNIESLATLGIESGGLFTLALGTVLNFNDSDILITNSAGKLTVSSTWATVGRTGRPFGVELTLTGNAGSYVNALKGYVDASNGGSTGLMSAVNCEIKMPTGACAGAFYPLEIEYVDTASTSFGKPGTGSQAGFMILNANGTVTDFDDDGVFMSINGLTAGATHMLSLDMHTLRMTLDNGTYAKYLVMSIAENYLSHSFSVLDANGRMAKFAGTVATPANPDGQGFVEIDLTVTGVATGAVAASSTWVNVTTGEGNASNTEGIMVRNDGIYEAAGGVITDVPIFYGGRFHAILGDSDFSQLCFASVNLDQVQTSVFHCNSEGNFGYTAGVHESAVIGSIPFLSKIDGTGIKYIRVYGTAA